MPSETSSTSWDWQDRALSSSILYIVVQQKSTEKEVMMLGAMHTLPDNRCWPSKTLNPWGSLMWIDCYNRAARLTF